MTIKEKLELMKAMEDKNRAANQAFVEAEKNKKAWKVSFAFVTDDQIKEDSFVWKAADITEMVMIAKEVLEYAAHSGNWVKWMIWDVGIMSEELLF